MNLDFDNELEKLLPLTEYIHLSDNDGLHDQNKAFGLFATSGKLTSFLGPMLVGTITMLSNSQKIGFSSAIFLLLIGLVIILKIKKIQ